MKTKIINPINILLFIIITLYIGYQYNNYFISEIKGNKTVNDSLYNINDSLVIEIDSLKFEIDSLKYEIEKRDNFEDFLRDMAYRESGWNQYSVNQYGMLGLYQFNPKTLNFLGYNYNRNEYLNSTQIQNKAMVSYLNFNKSILKPYIKRYDGKYHNGIYITASGILAGAHLTGAGGVIEFFDNKGKYKMYDGNNVHVSDYIKHFSGYDILALLENH